MNNIKTDWALVLGGKTNNISGSMSEVRYDGVLFREEHPDGELGRYYIDDKLVTFKTYIAKYSAAYDRHMASIGMTPQKIANQDSRPVTRVR